MHVINVPARISTNFGAGLNGYFRILEEVRELPRHEAITFNMLGCSFLTPFFLLPVMLLVEEERKLRPVFVDHGNSTFSSYAKTISFDGGLRPEDIKDGDYRSILEPYGQKSFLPIINFPAGSTGPARDMRETIVSVLNSLIRQMIQAPIKLHTGLLYLINEAINNIVEHSLADRGYIFAQYFPSKAYIDICIADVGIGILETYRRQPDNQIMTHVEALQKASDGLSTKDRPKAEGRGFGISTSREMLADGLKGTYFLMSGDAILVQQPERKNFAEVPSVLNRPGTLLALRIPYAVNTDFDPARYYE